MDAEYMGEVAQEVEPVMHQWATELLEWAKAGKEFMAEQAPLLAQEIVRWGFASAVLSMLLGIAIFAAGWMARRYILARQPGSGARDVWTDVAFANFAAVILPIVGSIVGGCIFFRAVHDGAQIWMAPRMYLIHYLSTWVR